MRNLVKLIRGCRLEIGGRVELKPNDIALVKKKKKKKKLRVALALQIVSVFVEMGAMTKIGRTLATYNNTTIQ